MAEAGVFAVGLAVQPSSAEDRPKMQGCGNGAQSQRPFESFAEALIAQPYDAYRDLRSRDPVHWDPVLRAWILTGYDEIRAALQDERLQVVDPSTALGVIGRKIGRDYGALTNLFSAIPFFQNGEAHELTRGVMVKLLNQKSLRQIERIARDIAAEIARGLAPRAEYEAISQFADPLPQRVMAHILGIDPADFSELQQIVNESTISFGLVPLKIYDVANQNVSVALELLSSKIVKAVNSRDESGLLTIYNNVPGEGMEKIENAAAATLFACVVGTETTAAQIGLLVRTLLDDPTLYQSARDDLGLVPVIVSEAIRLESSVQRAFRVSLSDCEIGDRAIAAGDRLILLLGAGNRDPETFANPDRVALDRRGMAHLAFGKGIHFCVGANLAQMEVAVALETFLGLPVLTRDGEETWYASRVIRRLTRLPVRRLAADAEGDRRP